MHAFNSMTQKFKIGQSNGMSIDNNRHIRVDHKKGYLVLHRNKSTIRYWHLPFEVSNRTFHMMKAMRKQ